MIKNISLLHWTLVVNFAVFFFCYGIVVAIHRKTGRLARQRNNLKNYFFYNGVIRFYMETFLNLLLASLLNVYTVDWNSPFSAIIYSNYASIFILSSTIVTLFILFIVYCRNADIMDQRDIRD